jgi:hypothetical protein
MFGDGIAVHTDKVMAYGRLVIGQRFETGYGDGVGREERRVRGAALHRGAEQRAVKFVDERFRQPAASRARQCN